MSRLQKGGVLGTQMTELTAKCPYCGAPDDGTCAYPSENKPGCWQVLHRVLDEKIMAELRRIYEIMLGSTGNST